MSEWKKVKLGDVCQIIDGDRGKNYPKNHEFFGSGYCLFLNTGNVTKEGFSFANNQFITKEKDELLRKGKIQRGDLILTTRGTVGNIAYYTNHIKYENVRINSGMVILRVNKENVDASFLYQLVRSKESRTYINSFCTGSAQPQLPIKNLSQICFEIPPLSTQHRIATILSRYDSLIENYQKQIKLLEEAAQRLYKEWFIDLRFPGHENTKIVDGVPEGWENKKLHEIAEVVMGSSPKSEFYNNDKQGLPFHQGVGSYGTRFVDDNVYSTSITRLAEPNSILFSVRAPVGRLNITKNKIIIGRGLAAMNHKDGFQSFLFYMLKERFFMDNIIGNGSIFASISKVELLDQEFIVPPMKTIKAFESLASKLDKKIQGVDTQLRLLTEARDRLLPKLMNGEIAV